MADLETPRIEGVLVMDRHPLLRVTDLVGRGRGVIAAGPIAKGTLLEAAPVIRMRPQDRVSRGHALFDYTFAWDQPPYDEAIALGLVSLVNHSDRPNATIRPDYASLALRLIALADVAAGQEIAFDYGVALWFDVEDAR